MTFVEPGDPRDLTAAVRAGFLERHGREAEVVARAPGRVNVIGEHTDYNAGLCLPLALAHATYAAVARRTDDRVRITSAQAEAPWEGTLDTCGPGDVAGWATYVAGVLWALREDGVAVPGVDVHVESTVPVGAGLSSSAALECSVAVAVVDLLGLPLDRGMRDRLIRACTRAESEVAGAPTGGLDQTVSLLAREGDALLLDFEDGSTRDVPLLLDDADLALLVIDTGVSHALVDGGYAARRSDCEEAARRLGVATLRSAFESDLDRLDDDRLVRRVRHVITENARVEACVAALERHDWPAVGQALMASHVSLRDDFEVSCPELDVAVDTAVQAGALGARMTGGGFGGSAVALVPQERLAAAVRAVDTAFVAHGWARPTHLRAIPSSSAAPR
ncbi:galactokinase [Nocardioides pacificus]